MTQLTFDRSCYNVVINKGTSEQLQIDGSVRIESAFDIMHNVTLYAKIVLRSLLQDPNFGTGNTQRVMDLLVALCLPQDHPHFRDMVVSLISTLHGIVNAVQMLMSVTRYIL